MRRHEEAVGLRAGTLVAMAMGNLDDLKDDIRRADHASQAAAHDARAAAQVCAAKLNALAGRAPRDLQSCATLSRRRHGRPFRPSEVNLTVLLGSVRLGPGGVPIEPDIHDPKSVRGMDPARVKEIARALGWDEEPAKQGGGGRRFFKPGTNRSDGIRVMDGDPKAPPGIKRGPYAFITRRGDTVKVPLKGNNVLSQGPGPGPIATGKMPPGSRPPAGSVQTPGKAGGSGKPGASGRPIGPGRPIEPVEPVRPSIPVRPIIRAPFIP